MIIYILLTEMENLKLIRKEKKISLRRIQREKIDAQGYEKFLADLIQSDDESKMKESIDFIDIY
jgi:hypothetical protein